MADVELGQSARVYSSAGRHGSLQLPLGALQRGGNGAASVWVVDPANSTLKAAAVTTGAYGSETVPVLTGVGAGDWVVAAGGHLLLGVGQPSTGAVCDARLRADRRVVVQAPGPVRGSAVHLQGDGGAHAVAGRHRRAGLAAGDRADREGADEHRRVRVHPLVRAPGRSAGDLHGPRQPAFPADSGPVVPGAQARGRHPGDAAARDRRPVLQR
ncbi:hypothetical protein G6F24_014001 [Rhizopus arrhizus]|nr:hypothetical protein G6F24_014001 [Rhizopus arrhizus]